MFEDSPEYIRRCKTPFKPTNVTLAEVRAVVPKQLFKKSTLKGLGYVFRSVFCAFALYKLAWRIDTFSSALVEGYGVPIALGSLVNFSLWGLYWYWQSVTLCGWWCLGHEAGHGTISNTELVNDLVGYSLDTFILTPFFAWRSTHFNHHKATMSIERDEYYIPRTRSDFGLQPESIAQISDYHDIFEEIPIYTLFRMIIMQLIGFQSYLLTNIKGSPRYPPGTNHFTTSSALFKPHDRFGVIASDVGLTVMCCILYMWSKEVGFSYFLKLYFGPYLFTNHWIVLLTYLQHSDPSIPIYRNGQWSFLRGALSTVDRPLLGWYGRFLLHNVMHDHIAHHLFPTIPFYNQPQVTEAIKKVLKDDYNYDSTNSFHALYRTFTQCCFVEDDGDILFYKNKDGMAARTMDTS